ncbi:ABC transporter substrate-binding protein [Paenibacillus sp. FSL F4-0087]|uniref:ABC transporter substrate-binding protein n=1 Tax=Paenibacillus TaxID=44249 RepID=UPI00096F802B|nr:MULTISPECIES: ABC transporter substrate-binding protein [Paenibacillus]MDR9744043.1 ABC transporter substrate-binding protein [Paenibacillus taichungensis]OME80268.1 ABC transporter substrate-binding protein [Paenibacillus pabuli]PIH59492.1 ABC transporter substrate-binding protein [Paenibacillus sp. LK1]
MVHSMRKIAECSVALTLSLSMLAGCSSNNEGSENKEGNVSDSSPMTLTFFGADSNANWNKMQDDVGKEITKQTGITLDAEFAVSDPAQRLALIAASGDYPDLISPKGDLDKLVDAGAMLDLTDLIDQHAPNIKKLFGDQIKRLRYSNDDPSIYVIPTYSAIDGVNFVAGAGFELQHRAVQEAGYPQIKTLQDYENVIRSYLEKHPTDENGNKNIGMTLNADDWHMQITVTNPAAETTGKSGDGEYYIDPESHKATYHFRTEGEKEYFQWLNHMYNTGLLDQESFVQKNDQYLAKVASGRVIGLIDADWGYSDGEKALKSSGKNDQTYGHYSVTLSDQYKDNRYQSTGFMAGWGVGITESAEDPVRAIKFLDFLASEEGQILNYWGVESKQYTMEDGKRVVPADVQQRIINDNIAFTRESGVGLYTNMGGHYGDGVKDSTGNYYTKNFPEQIIENYTDVEKETLQAYDATTWMDLFPNEKDFPVKPWGAVWNISVPSDDEINIIANKVKDITWKQIPLAVMAKPEEFDAIWNNYQQKLIDAGVEKMEQGFTKYVQDRVKLWNE